MKALMFSGLPHPNFSRQLCLRCSLPNRFLNNARALTHRTGGNEFGRCQRVRTTPHDLSVESCMPANKLILQAGHPCPSNPNTQ